MLPDEIVRILESDAFERRASTGSEPFFLLICPDATKFVLLIVLSLKETICPRICRHSRPKSAKSPLRYLNSLLETFRFEDENNFEYEI